MKFKEREPTKVLASLENLVVALMHARNERAAERQLMGLSNHSLRDIGVSRAEITFLVKDLEARRVN